jgi:uncharacterized damage-inducible protein DinB
LERGDSNPKEGSINKSMEKGNQAKLDRLKFRPHFSSSGKLLSGILVLEGSVMKRQLVKVTTIVIVSGAALALTVAITGGGALMAQGNPLSADVKRDYKSVRDYFIRAAEKMPEADYGFRPSPDVRSFAQQVAHVADDQYNLCAPAKGEIRKAAYTDIEDRLSKKADLVPALKEAFAYCDGAYDALTDDSGAEIVKTNKGGRTRFSMLNWNLWHTWEHYGNVVVYLRMKGLVPPSSEKRQTK